MEEKHARLAMVSVSLKNVEAKNGIQNADVQEKEIVYMRMVERVGIRIGRISAIIQQQKKNALKQMVLKYTMLLIVRKLIV